MALRHRQEWSPTAYGTHNDPSVVDLTGIPAFQYNPADPVDIASPTMHATSPPLLLMDIYSAGSHSSRTPHDDVPLINVEVMQTHLYYPNIDLLDGHLITPPLQSTFSLAHPPSNAEIGAQTIDFDTTGKHEHGREAHQTDRPPVVRELAPQETYKIPRRPRGVGVTGKPDVIEFIADGKRGIRLSDVSEDNWARFEGGEDRPLSNEGRLQIIIRLHVRLLLYSPVTLLIEFPSVLRMCALALEGETCAADLVCGNLIRVAGLHRRLHCKTQTNHKKEAGRRNSEVHEEIHSGTFARYHRSSLDLTQSRQREKMNGHTGDHPQCGWGDVSLENVFLTRITRVSVASWQPEIFVGRPLIPPQAADSSSSSGLLV